jgi:hypothetical protein
MLEVIPAVFMSFSPSCARDANCAWLEHDYRNLEIVIVIQNGINGRAVVPKYSQCNHPHGSRLIPCEKLVIFGDISAIL